MGNILLNLIEDCESKALVLGDGKEIRELEIDRDESCYLPVKKALELTGYLINDYKEDIIFKSFMMVLAP